MSTIVLGDKNQFAIELRRGASSKLGFVKIWLNNFVLGADEEVYFSYVQGEMQYILANRRVLDDFPYKSDSAEDIVNRVLRDKSLSGYIMKGFGESFDDFYIICFYTNSKVNFVWKLTDHPYFHYPDYSTAAQISSIEVKFFEDVIQRFNNEIEFIR